MQPFLSIVIPIYNTEKYLPNCVESVLVQKFDNWELLLINDGSTDSCPQIIDDYSRADSRMRAFHKQNGGVYSGFNLGLEQAHGKYIMFGGSDDILEPNALEKIAEQAEEYDYDIIFINFATYVCDNEQNIIRLHTDKSPIKDKLRIIEKLEIKQQWIELLRFGLLRNPVNAYKLSIINKYRFREDIYGADYLLNLQIADDITSVSCYPEHLYNALIYENIEDENFNVSNNKYYTYEHDMFNEFYLGYKSLFLKWNLLDDSRLALISTLRMEHYFKVQLNNVFAFNNKNTPAENIDIITNYYDDIILETAIISERLTEVDNTLFNTIMHIIQNNEISSDFDNPVLKLYLAFSNQAISFEQLKLEITNALLNYKNPYRIGFENYKTLSAEYPQIADHNLLNYLETERTARKLLYTGNFEQALDTIIQLFNSAISTPEQYVILALCGYHLGLTEDSKNAIETGLDIFPDYLRLEELRDIINIERNN
ncbi:MAG: glycosyltransferase [Firmicutes bacterium]|nr:glycosyltransferase [Bacillota bacterium]